MTQSRPNLLYIHTDQHNPFVTGCYGDPLVETPNLDRLAAEGALFNACYCASPICVPSRMAMLTARHPHHNQVWTNSHILNSGIPTLAHSMGAAGYQPTLIGRMHSVGPDQLHGYANRLVGDHSSNHIGSPTIVDRGILDGTAGPHRTSLIKAGAGQSSYQVHDEDVTKQTIDHLNELGKRRQDTGTSDPFSLTVGYMLPHAPFVARADVYDHYRSRMTLPQQSTPYDQVEHPYLKAWRKFTDLEEPTPDEMVLRARAAYWALVHEIDIMIGQLIDALHANGLAENTLIIYTSDHGDMVGEHGLWWKHVFYEASARVPLIMHWPGQIEAGQRSDRVVSSLDVTATMLDALGAPPLPNADGRSFLGLISETHPTPEWEDIAFSEYCADQYTPGNPTQIAERNSADHSDPNSVAQNSGTCYQRMIRHNQWKLIYDHNYPPQLFNLTDDPNELVNRADDPTCATILADLTTRVLDGWSPDAIIETMAQKREEVAVLSAWAKNTNPEETHRWDLQPEMNWLDEGEKI